MRGVATAALAALAVIASFVAGKAARDAILLSEFPITRLPLFVGMAAVASLPVILVVGRLLATYGPRRIVPLFSAISGVLLVAEWLLLAASPRIGAAAIFFHLTTFGAVLVSGFWSIINERFDARTARQHMGRIGAAATIGGIVGGLIAERAAVYLEPGAILLVIAGMQLGCAAVQLVLARDVEHVAPTRSAPRRPAIKIVAETPLLRVLASIVVLGAIGATALDYVFKAEVVAASGDDGPLRFFAIYYTATNVLTALAQIAFGRVVLDKLKVAPTIATLPATVTIAGTVALAVPGLVAIVIARSSEMIVRSSLYRAAYELIYTPLAEEYKRSTKVLLDVGAERLGDLFGSQLVGLLVYIAAPSAAVVGIGIVAGVCGLGLALLLLRRSYTAALEASLRERRPVTEESQPAWSTVGIPLATEPGDLALSTLELPRVLIQAAVQSQPAREPVVDRIANLRATDRKRIVRALAEPLTVELVPHVVRLLAQQDVVAQATAALRAIAPQCTGALVDTLLDSKHDFAVRRRLPPILEVGEPALATWGLTKGLADERFEVRYRCAKALARIRANGHDVGFTEPAAFAAIERELSVEASVWKSYQLLDPAADTDELVEQAAPKPSRGLEHVFDLLALALPSDPVRIARQALHTTDRTLRGTALEYLESVLPGELRDRLWPHIEPAPAPAPAPVNRRQRDAIITELQMSRAAIMAKLRESAEQKREP